MKEQITATLRQIAADQRIEILFACETGSRAWGYPSPNSDYDVFFIFKHSLEMYLGMDTVIDSMDRNNLLKDYCTPEAEYKGYDIYKTATLFRRSNPQVVEWLQAPDDLVYLKQAFGFASKLYHSIDQCSLKRIGHFHFNQARDNFKDYIEREQFASAKRYLVVLRGIFATMFLTQMKQIPPFKFDDLFKSLESFISPKTIGEIYSIIEQKKMGSEIAKGKRNDVLDEFIKVQLTNLRPRIDGTDDQAPDTKILNRILFDEMGI